MFYKFKIKHTYLQMGKNTLINRYYPGLDKIESRIAESKLGVDVLWHSGKMEFWHPDCARNLVLIRAI